MPAGTTLVSDFYKEGQVTLVPREKVRPFKDQPRSYFDKAALRELADSISMVGQLTPILVRRLSVKSKNPRHKFELVDGQRRWHACDMLGKSKMRAVVGKVNSGKEQFLISTVANFGHADHTPLETAHAIARIRSDYDLPVEKVAKALGRSTPWAYQHLSLLKLDPKVQELMSPTIPEDQRFITFSVATRLARIPEASVQRKIAKEIQGGRMKMTSALAHIRKRAHEHGLGSGLGERSPKDEFNKLLNLLKRTKRDGNFYLVMPGEAFNQLFQSRSEKVRQDVRGRIRECIEVLVTLHNNVPGVRKKVKVTRRY